jgi:ABC-type sugar transport system permease subunit
MLLAPAFILLALIVVYPIGKLIFNSFFDLRLSGGGARPSSSASRTTRWCSPTPTSGTPPRTPCSSR